MSRTLRRSLRGILAVLLAAALALPASAAFAGKGTPGGGGGGKPPGTGEEAANSLSVPAIFLDGNPFSLDCDGGYTAPSGTPLTGYTVPGYFYVQKTHSWQAGCLTPTDATIDAAAAWGDNLTGDAKLKIGAPIRVEMGLDAGAQGLTGFDVVKLEPAQLDRLSPYGTAATPTDTGYTSTPVTPYLETRVWTAGAWLKIYPLGSPSTPVVNEPAKAEINSTGRVVYGYNLRVSTMGTYVLEFTAPHVNITSLNKGTVIDNASGDTVTLEINVGGGGGGGGKPIR